MQNVHFFPLNFEKYATKRSSGIDKKVKNFYTKNGIGSLSVFSVFLPDVRGICPRMAGPYGGKGGLFFGRPCGKGAFVMRKAACVMLSLVLLLAFSVPAFATDNQDLTLEEKQALYAKYEEMVAAANEEYGLDISVLPFDELETFYSEEEFAQMLAEFCGILSAPTVRVGGAAPTGAIRGAGTTTVPYSTTQVHGNTTVSITIFGTFNVSAWPDGTYYIRSMAFDAIASSSSSYLYYVKDGDGRVTGYADGGRTLIVTQDFDIYTYNVFSASTSVNAYFYFDDNTGEIIAL